MFLARDKDERLFLYNSKPIRKDSEFYPADDVSVFITFHNNYVDDCEYDIRHDCVELDNQLYTNVTWENSPIELKLMI